VDTLSDIAANIDGQTICALGEAAAWPIRAFLKNFRGDFESACRGGCGKKGGTPHV
jgi:NADH-quinone oxidoreductase subunit F